MGRGLDHCGSSLIDCGIRWADSQWGPGELPGTAVSRHSDIVSIWTLSTWESCLPSPPVPFKSGHIPSEIWSNTPMGSLSPICNPSDTLPNVPRGITTSKGVTNVGMSQFQYVYISTGHHLKWHSCKVHNNLCIHNASALEALLVWQVLKIVFFFVYPNILVPKN